MKKTLFLLVLLFVVNVSARVVYTEPEFATKNDSIIVYFDATKGNQGLMDHSGDVYAHTGLITDESNNGTDWKYVIADWSTNLDKAKLEQVNDNLYKLVIGNIFDFYSSHETGASPSGDEIIEKLAFVFRNSDGSKVGKAVGENDIYYDLFEFGISVVIDSPAVNNRFGHPMRDPSFFELDNKIGFKIKVAAIGTEVDSLKIYKNDALIMAAGQVETMEYWEIATERGPYRFEIIVSDTAGLSDTLLYGAMVNKEVVEEPLPAGTEPGINFRDDGSAVVVLFAPYKEFIYLIGSFNDWMVDNDFLMKRYYVSEDSVMYWHKIENITPDQVYQYQFLIDGDLRIADPYGRLILDSRNDPYIEAETYPGLPQYPKNKTEQLVSAFEKKTSEFQWTDQDYVKPDKEKLVFYEMLIRDFTTGHSYNSTLEKLDYLDSLGVNVIELMPINEFEGNLSWGYNPSMYFAVDKYYGTAEDLKNFVNECHNRGMAVVTDVVYNHAFGSNTMARMYLNESTWQPSEENPWFNPTAPHTDYNWGYDFDHSSKHTQYFLDRVNHYWIDEFHIDGYRFDFTRGFTNKSGGSGGYDANRIKILKRMADKIWEKDSSALVVLEHLVDENSGEMKELAEYGMLLWGNMNHSYNEAAMGYDSDLSWGFYETRGWNEPNLVTYMESHDEERLMYKNLNYGNSAGDYDIQHLYTALQRQKLVNAFFLTLPGPKMIWQFGELGYDYSIDYNGRTGIKPIRWDYYQNANRRNLYETIKALLQLRNENDIFTSKQTTVNLDLDGFVKKIKLTGNGNALVVGNFDVEPRTTTLNFVHGGNWYDFFSGDTMEVNGSIEKNLQPGEFHIYSDGKFFTPQSDLLVGTDKQEIVADSFELLPAYPNPFNPETNIVFTIPETGDVQIRIYNILGEIVFDNTYRQLNSGYHTMTWNTTTLDNISSGIYIIQAKFENKIQNSRILLIK